MKRAILFLLLFALAACTMGPPAKLPQTERQGSLVISQGTYAIDNQQLTLYGDLVVNGTGTLLVRNATILFAQAHNNEYHISIADSATVFLDNARILTNDKWMYADITEHPTVFIRGYRGSDPNIPWWNTGWNSTVSVVDSVIGISVHGNSKLLVQDSDVFLEMLFGGSSGAFTLPAGFVDEYSLLVPTSEGQFSIRAVNSTIREWGTTIMQDSNITFVNSTITIGMNAGSDWPVYTAPHISLSGLHAKRYESLDIPFDTNHITLVDTTVTRWYPQAFGNALMEINDSDLADLQWNGNNAHVIVRGNGMEIAYARDNVTYEIHDSSIAGDVTATGTSRIYLYNTRVDGEIQEIEGGRVISP